MLVTTVTADGNLLTVTRATNGSTAAPHVLGAAVTVLTNYAVNALPTCSLVPSPHAPVPACTLHPHSPAPAAPTPPPTPPPSALAVIPLSAAMAPPQGRH